MPRTDLRGTQCQGQALMRSGRKEVTMERCQHPARLRVTYKVNLGPQSGWSREKSFDLCFQCARAIRKMESTKVIRERALTDG